LITTTTTTTTTTRKKRKRKKRKKMSLSEDLAAEIRSDLLAIYDTPAKRTAARNTIKARVTTNDATVDAALNSPVWPLSHAILIADCLGHAITVTVT